jgi:hypothetical protein
MIKMAQMDRKEDLRFFHIHGVHSPSVANFTVHAHKLYFRILCFQLAECFSYLISLSRQCYLATRYCVLHHWCKIMDHKSTQMNLSRRIKIQ